MSKKEKKRKETVKVKKVKKDIKKKKTLIQKFVKLIKDNMYDVIFIILSIIALIIGNFAIGWKKALIIVLFIDVLVWFLPVISFIGNKTKRKFKRKSLAQIFLWCVIGGLALCICFGLFIVIKSPEFNPQNLYAKNSTIIYDKDGQIVAKLGKEKREKISYEDMPEVLIDAIVATEDSQFFEHNGFNPLRFLKASLSQIVSGGGGGASTITMQVSKNAFTSTKSSGIEGIIRKFTDIYLSIFKIEKTYTKEEILEFYVNSYYMGGGAYGVEQACQTYFGKSVNEINLAEAAMIAGIFKGGGAYDPFIYPQNAEYRRREVLSFMRMHGYITQEEVDIALQLTVDELLLKDRKYESYQSFIDTVVVEVQEKTGQNPYNVPMEIYTTLDTKKQEYINGIMNGETYKWENDVVQAGIVVNDTNTGGIVAIGTGRNKSGALSFNYATMINRQIGSTAKPLYDYGPAIEYNNLAPSQPIIDDPHSYTNGGVLHNWDNKYLGYTTVRQALSLSRNVPALKTFQNLKNSNVKTFVTNLGLHPQIESGMIFESHSIGGYNGESPLSMAAAYAAFANGGTYIEPHTFTKIIFRESGEEYINNPSSKRVMSAQTAYLITDMLLDAAVHTTGANRVNGIQYADKTGTTNYDSKTLKDNKLPSKAVNDLWVVGYSRDFSVALWYGYDRINSNYYNVSGSGKHTGLFKNIIKGVLTGTKNFSKPSDITSAVIEKGTSEVKLASKFTPDKYKTTEYFKSGTEPTEESDRFNTLPMVTGVNIREENSQIYLSWNHIPVPTELDANLLTAEFSPLFSDSKSLDKFIESRISENQSLLGNIQYNVYLKDDSGNLSLLGKTSDNHFEYAPSLLKNGTMTFAIKTTYSIFEPSISSSAEISINIDNIAEEITSNINGLDTITLNIGDNYVESDKPVIVLEGLNDVTNNASITKKITDASGNQVNNIDTSSESTYTVTYDITYNSYHNTISKKIIIK